MPKDPIKTLELIEKRLDEKVEKILRMVAFKIKRRVDSKEFIKWKSRRKPIVVGKARLVGSIMEVRVRTASGWKWGIALVGPEETFTVENFEGMLAIPTDAARKTFRGKKIGPKNYKGTTIHHNIIWGKAGWGGVGRGGG